MTEPLLESLAAAVRESLRKPDPSKDDLSDWVDAYDRARLPKVALMLIHRFQHFVEDEDVRRRDPEYDRAARQELLKQADELSRLARQKPEV